MHLLYYLVSCKKAFLRKFEAFLPSFLKVSINKMATVSHTFHSGDGGGSSWLWLGVELCHLVYSIVLLKMGMKGLWTAFSLTVPLD